MTSQLKIFQEKDFRHESPSRHKACASSAVSFDKFQGGEHSCHTTIRKGKAKAQFAQGKGIFLTTGIGANMKIVQYFVVRFYPN